MCKKVTNCIKCHKPARPVSRDHQDTKNYKKKIKNVVSFDALQGTLTILQSIFKHFQFEKFRFCFNQEITKEFTKPILRHSCIILFLVSVYSHLHAQENTMEQKITFNGQSQSLENFLIEIERKTDFRFIYSPMLLPVNKTIELPGKEMSLQHFLDFLKYNLNILYQVNNNSISLKLSASPTKINISGFVEDAKTGERLIAANVYNADYNGTITNNYGYYSMSIPMETTPVYCSFVGYKPFTVTSALTSDTFVNVMLEPALEITEVRIVGREKMLINEKDNKTTYLPARFIDNIPAVFGEGDILKAIQLVPGTQSGLENTNGISVRGGSPGENLIMLDGVKLYHYSHLLGILSIFDNNIVKTSKIIKGGIPANYGGRSSSVIDIVLNEGDNQHFCGDFTLGFPTSRLSLEGPMQQGESSYLVSARSSYRNLFNMVPEELNQGDADKHYFFYDITAKTNVSLSSKNKLFFSLYTGSDIFQLYETNENLLENIVNENFTRAGWGNKASILKWNHVFNSRLFSNTSVAYSNSEFRQQNKYTREKQSDFGTTTEKYTENINSNIEDITAQVNFELSPNLQHLLRFGYNFSYFIFEPNANGFIYSDLQNFYSTSATTVNQNMNAVENAVYFNDDIELGELNFSAGLRTSVYSAPGKSYLDISPRLSANFSVNKKLNLFGTFCMMKQPLHLLAYTHLILPTDLWVGSTSKVSPSQSNQYSLGLTYAFTDNIRFTTEGYYKKQDGIIEYDRGPEFLNMNIGWEDKIVTGTGKNYGLEFLLQKTSSVFSGWISYTYSRALRKFKGDNSWIPYEYDKPHVLNLVANYKIVKNLEIGGTWIFTLGRPFTFSSTSYNTVIEDYESTLFDTKNYNYQINRVNEKNNARMLNYHRLDISAKYQQPLKNGVLSVKAGVFNVYNRHNPIFMYAKDETMYTTSIFPILPFFQCKYRFKVGKLL